MLRSCHLCFCFLCLVCSLHGTSASQNHDTHKQLSLGAILDLTSCSGKEQKLAIDIAIKSFYPHLRHRPTLHVKDSRGDPVRAFHFAKSFIKKHHVRAIIGLGTWKEAMFVAELCNKSNVPLLSLANDIPPWTSSQWPFLVNSARSQDTQLRAMAAMVQSWRWREVNIIFEDFISAVATSISPHLHSALQEAHIDIADVLPLPPVASYHTILEKLERFKHGNCRVFIVHTSIKLAIDIFKAAESLGIMKKDSVWITTSEISNFVDTLDASIKYSMQGVLGVKSYSSCKGRHCKDFSSRFKSAFASQYPKESLRKPGNSALQAYDATWSVALAMEGKTRKSKSRDLATPNNSVASPTGKQLLDKILQSDFQGVTGFFKFSEAKLAPAQVFKIINMVGKTSRELGYWSEGAGFSEKTDPGSTYSKSMKNLGDVFWPGGTWTTPTGCAAATCAKRLKIGVPTTATFPEFVKVINDSTGDKTSFQGFSIEVFKAMTNSLPYYLPYDFFPYKGTYDSLIEQISLKKFDAVVADTNIIANRCNYAQFSQPYSPPGLQMVVYANRGISGRAWLFTKPFTSRMWVLTGVINIYNAFVVWLIERDHDPNLRGTVWNQIGSTVSLAFTTLFSHQSERLHNNLSRMVMIVWLFTAFFITHSFTASLTTLLTVERLDPLVVDVETLKKNGAKVGCSGNGFVVKYLEEVIGFEPGKIKGYTNEDDYPGALIRGDIAAAFMEVPYVKLFLARNCKGFNTSGETFNVGGFGFAFPKDSPYLFDVSEAILKLSENGTLRNFEKDLIASCHCTASNSSDHDGNSLGVGRFLGLFVIAFGTTTVAFLLYVYRLIYQDRIPLLRKKQPNLPLIDESMALFPQRQQHQHHPTEDRLVTFAWEMENHSR